MKHFIFRGADIDSRNQNMKYNQAMLVFRGIMEYMDTSGFTLQELVDTFNTQTKILDCDESEDGIRVLRVRFGKSHLDTLVNAGILFFDPEENMYSINHNSPAVANYMTESYAFDIDIEAEDLVFPGLTYYDLPDRDEFADFFNRA